MMVRPLMIIAIVTAALALAGMLVGQQQEAQDANSPPVTVRFKDDKAVDRSSSSDVSSLRFADGSAGDGTSAENVGDDAEQRASRRPDKHTPVDPVDANGPIFEDWPKPDAVLVFSGEQDGYLEPCGCAGLNNQKGGLKRRHTLIQQLEARDWPVLAMDLGGQVRRFGKQAEIKLQRTYESLIDIGYSAVAFGPQDLRMEILAAAINLDLESNPLVSANVGIIDFDSGFTKRFKVVEVGGLKIGITSVLGKHELFEVRNASDVVVEEPYQALPVIIPELIAADCDHLILLAHTSHDEAKDLARRFHEFDWVVAAKGADEPPNAPTPILNEKDEVIAQLIECGHKGMYVVAVGLYKDGPVRFRYQRVPLDHRFEDSRQMQDIFVDYQKELETLGLDGLGIRPMDHPTGREFAGSAACADCHSAAHEIFQKTPHSHATRTLQNLNPPRHHDLECLSCHATGWNPQKFFPYTSGFLGLEGPVATPHLTGNGCENCHGPAKSHADAENGFVDATQEEMEKLRVSLRLRIVENEGNQEGQVFGKGSVVEMCMECHDLDNSPDFDFQAYWPEVKHEGLY